MTAISHFDSMVDFYIQHFPNALLWLDTKGKILRTNKIVCQQFDHEQELLETLSIFYVFPNINIIQWNKLLRQLATESTIVKEMDCLTQTEEEFKSSVKISL